jgi:ribonuclease HI
MHEDPHALKLYVDGNAYNNPGGNGGMACYAKYPEASQRPDEEIFSEGFHETTNNRMELQACIRALEYVRDNAGRLGVERVQIISDSRYVCDNQGMPATWRKNGWKTNAGRPVENSDLWKRFLLVRPKCGLRSDIGWQKGKKSTILKSVDRAAKAAGRRPSKYDRGFRTGKVGRSKLTGGASSLFPANGQQSIIRIYRSALLRKTGHKIFFDVFDDAKCEFSHKCNAYVGAAMIDELHRGHSYRVWFNADPRCPTVLEITEELTAVPHPPLTLPQSRLVFTDDGG